MLNPSNQPSDSEESNSSTGTFYLSDNSGAASLNDPTFGENSNSLEMQPKAHSKRKCHKFRNFWSQEIYKRLTCDKRADFFLKLFGSNKFSWEFFQSLHELFEEFHLSNNLITNFHQAIIDIFSKLDLFIFLI